MSKLLWSLSSYDNRVASLVFVVRRWAREASITQSTPGPWFSNFQMTLLVLFYLQSVDILPKLNYINEQSVLASAQESILTNGIWSARANRVATIEILLGDLSDDWILMNELENIRQVQMSNVNNSSLGKQRL